MASSVVYASIWASLVLPEQREVADPPTMREEIVARPGCY